MSWELQTQCDLALQSSSAHTVMQLPATNKLVRRSYSLVAQWDLVRKDAMDKALVWAREETNWEPVAMV